MVTTEFKIPTTNADVAEFVDAILAAGITDYAKLTPRIAHRHKPDHVLIMDTVLLKLNGRLYRMRIRET